MATEELSREWESELFRIAVGQFDQAAELVGISSADRLRMVTPRRSMVVNFPVRVDSDEVEAFTGFRVQHVMTTASSARIATSPARTWARAPLLRAI